MGIFDRWFPNPEDDESVSLEEIIKGLEDEKFEETTTVSSSISVAYIIIDSDNDIFKVKDAIKNNEIVILNYDNLKGSLKQKEFLISLGAALKELGADVRKIKNYNILIIVPRGVKIIKR